MKYLYYGFGGGLGHITRFNAFCHTFSVNPILLTALPKVANNEIKTFAKEIFLLPQKYYKNKTGLRNWIIECINKIKPDKFIIDTFPGGILGELTDLKELDNIEVEYIARILKTNVYLKRISGNFPKFSKIWQIEDYDEKQTNWLKNLALLNNIKIEKINLIYPDSDEDKKIILPNNCWLIIHSGSVNELKELYEYANDIASLENKSPNYVVIGQCNKPDFLPTQTPYYSIYPVTNLLNKAEKVFSGAGFNIMHQMKEMKEKHVVLPFERPLDDQFLRVKQKVIMK